MRGAVALVLMGSLGAGCGMLSRTPPAAPERPPSGAARPAIGLTQTGVASWYGNPHHGKATTSGELYDMHQLTAAHRTLPLGTVVDVANLRTGQNVRVRINDRGPFAKGRIIDLSYAAAREIGLIGRGVDTVQVTVVSLP